MTVDAHRLSRAVVPRRYQLELEPDIEAATFTGSVVIEADVAEARDHVVLNAVELRVIDAAIVDATGRRHDASVTDDPDTERVTLHLTEEVPAGSVTIEASFEGSLNDKLVGFYRSTFNDDDGGEHAIATTQLQATHARRMFPCFDEPDLKAVFGIRVVIRDGQTVLSNGIEVHREDAGDGRTRVTFADTMVMSTYLVAVVVGELELTAPVDVDGVPLRLVSVPGKGDRTTFALEVGEFALRFLTTYYDIPYPAQKLDLVAVPDFAFGAMENLGCVMFRESLLIVDPREATRVELERIVDVISHEIAHMWFGDLVTMRWWNGIWLNEAFATFMETKTTDAFRPAWDRWASFGVARAAVFDTDSLASTRAIEYEVVSPEEAEGMFDVLTYEKGGAVVRMLEQYLGEERMRDGIRHYLRTHLHGNTETTDLWDAIEEVTGEPVRRIMDSWIFQGGFPVIEVREHADGIELRQERFLFDQDADDDTLWAVPLVLTVSAGGASTITKLLLDERQRVIETAGVPDLVKANTGAAGFYRVRLSPKLLATTAASALDALTPVERFALVDDAWASVVAGHTTSVEFVRLAEALRDETDVRVWRAITTGLKELVDVADDATRPALVARCDDIVRGRWSSLGLDPIDGEPDTDRELRGLLTEFRGKVIDDAAVVDWARATNDRVLAGEQVEPSLAAAALRVTAAWADVATFERLVARFHDAPNPQEQLRVLYALPTARDADVFGRVLDLTLDTNEVRSQSAGFVLRLALQNRRHQAEAWRRISLHWSALVARLPSSMVPRLMEGIRTIDDPVVAAEIEAFAAEHRVPQGEKPVAQHLERMHVSVALAQRERARLADALA